MIAVKTFFSPDENTQFIVVGSEKRVDSFGLSQLYSRELFPNTHYCTSSSEKIGAYTLRARHYHKDGNLTVHVYRVNN